MQHVKAQKKSFPSFKTSHLELFILFVWNMYKVKCRVIAHILLKMSETCEDANKWTNSGILSWIIWFVLNASVGWP